MAIATFLYPIVDSGFFFELSLKEFITEKRPNDRQLKIKYSLTNIHAFPFQIPIAIAYQVHLDYRQPGDFTHTMNRSISSDHVIDLQSGTAMYGYGDDHHVVFHPGELREFLILFKPTSIDFQSLDISFFMKPPDHDYGLYWLRYDLKSERVIERYCERTYPQRIAPA
jgi:hypothetical protein